MTKSIKERPILFSGEMVRAILDGRKTQTRRIVKPQPPAHLKWAGWIVESSNRLTEGMACWADNLISKREFQNSPCPFGKPGDRLWVRETWSINDIEFGWKRGITERQGVELINTNTEIIYRADGEWKDQFEQIEAACPPWRPSIHMPRWASRITLEIKAVRVERLQDISKEDALAEGFTSLQTNEVFPHGAWSARQMFGKTWINLYGKEAFDQNPWVWVIDFEVIK